MIPRVLTIAGSDSGGGAGVAADLKAFASCGAYGALAITAVTAQNTVGVVDLAAVAPELVAAQISCVLGDIGADAIKVGMLSQAATVEAVAATLAAEGAGIPLVVDPVLASSTGATLLDPGALDLLKGALFPLAAVITPNLAEARALLGDDGFSTDEELVRGLFALGSQSVVLTGGHREQRADLFCSGGDVVEIPMRWVDGTATHGSGCTHSAALAAQLARGLPPLEAARAAQEIVACAIEYGLGEIGDGAGPVDVLALLRENLVA